MNDDVREGGKIIALAVGAACGYGILHDLVTTRVCLEYFTVAHPPIFGGTHDPTLLALGWGVIATWWVGLPLGILLAGAARFGSYPKLPARDLLTPVPVALVLMGMTAFFAGFTAYNTSPVERNMDRPEAHFAADYAAHTASYGSGALAGIVLTSLTIRRRYHLQRRAPV